MVPADKPATPNRDEADADNIRKQQRPRRIEQTMSGIAREFLIWLIEFTISSTVLLGAAILVAKRFRKRSD